MRTLLQHGTLILKDGVVQRDLLIEDGLFSDAVLTTKADVVIDASGLYIAPGFIDIHVHGGGGHDFMEASDVAFESITSFHLSHGTTGIVPTAVSSSFQDTQRFLDAYGKADSSQKITSRLLGAHLEGPYLSMLKKGAHDPEYLKNPLESEYTTLVNKYPFITRYTIACELPGALAMGDYLATKHINASIGHSAAYGDEITEAIRHGFTSVTHLYNAMSSVGEHGGNKAAGVAEMALLNDTLYAEIIADLIHVPKELILLAYKTKTADKLILVSDCLSPAGMPSGHHQLGGLAVEAKEAVYLAGTKTLAGSVIASDGLVRNAVKIGIPLADAVKMVSLTPARLLGIDQKLGSIEAGKLADFVLLDQNLKVKAVNVLGKLRFMES